VNITGSVSDCTAVLKGFAQGTVPLDPVTGTPMTNPATGSPFTQSDPIPIKALACTRQGGTSCSLFWPGPLDSGRNNFKVSIDGNPVRPDNLPANIYIKGGAGLGLMQTSSARDTEYTGMMIVLNDIPATAPACSAAPAPCAFNVTKSILPVNTTTQTWCAVGATACAFAFPGNHFLGLMTTGNIQLPGPGGSPRVVTAFIGNAITVRGQVQVGGVFSGATFDMGSNVPKFFQVPYDLNWLPVSFFPNATGVTKVVVNNWRECLASPSSCSAS
jgi:hypothetical protein